MVKKKDGAFEEEPTGHPRNESSLTLFAHSPVRPTVTKETGFGWTNGLKWAPNTQQAEAQNWAEMCVCVCVCVCDMHTKELVSQKVFQGKAQISRQVEIGLSFKFESIKKIDHTIDGKSSFSPN